MKVLDSRIKSILLVVALVISILFLYYYKLQSKGSEMPKKATFVKKHYFEGIVDG